jgi:hypothetical protein
MRVHPSTANLLRWFEYAHLPGPMQAVARPLQELAWQYAETLPDGPELHTGLRKLLEAKDCLVRARITADPAYHHPPAPPAGGPWQPATAPLDAQQIHDMIGRHLHPGPSAGQHEVPPTVALDLRQLNENWGD